MAKPVKVRTSSGEWADLAVQVPSANDPTFTGTTSSSQFNSTQSSGDEGGEIKFAKAATNTTLNTGVTLDVYQDKVRLFETAGTNRGGYFDMTTLSTGVGTNLSPGLTLINKTDFSGTSTLSLNNVFTSTYQNYRIVFSNLGHNAAGNTYWRMRASGSDATGSNYMGNWWSFTNTATNRFWSTATNVPELFDNYANFAIVDIFQPNEATFTYVNSIANNYGSGNNAAFNPGSGTHGLTTAYDGISFIRTSGNFSGTVRVYGYRNS